MFSVYVNLKIRTFQWSAVQLCGEMALGKGGGERLAAIMYCWLLAAAAACPWLSISQVGPPA